MIQKSTIDAQKIIDLLGGNAKTADLWQVTPGAVSQWLTNGIPSSFLKFLKVQRPDVIAAATTKHKARSKKRVSAAPRTKPARP